MSEETPIRQVEQTAEMQRQAFTVLNEMFGDGEFKTMAGWHMKDAADDHALVLEANEDVRGEIYPRVTVDLTDNGDFSCTVSQHTDNVEKPPLYSLTYANTAGEERLTIKFDHPDGFLNDTSVTFDEKGEPIETVSHYSNGGENRITLANQGESRGRTGINGLVATNAKRYILSWQKETGFSIPYDERISGGVEQAKLDPLQTFTETTRAWKSGSTNPVIK